MADFNDKENKKALHVQWVQWFKDIQLLERIPVNKRNNVILYVPYRGNITCDDPDDYEQ